MKNKKTTKKRALPPVEASGEEDGPIGLPGPLEQPDAPNPPSPEGIPGEGEGSPALEVWDLDRVTPYDRNPRINTNAVTHVLESLRRHGQVRPLIVSAPGHPFCDPVLCCGHTTLKALREFGAKRAIVQLHRFASEQEFVDYNIRDNKSSEFAQWDEAELARLAAEMEIDLASMGFVEADWQGDLKKIEELDETGESAESSVKIVCESKDKPAVTEEVKALVKRMGWNAEVK